MKYSTTDSRSPEGHAAVTFVFDDLPGQTFELQPRHFSSGVKMIEAATELARKAKAALA